MDFDPSQSKGTSVARETRGLTQTLGTLTSDNILGANPSMAGKSDTP
jgi:hypothetical protein